MRLFTGVELGPQITPGFARLSDELRQRVARLAPRARITWVPAHRAHVTVRFIGHVDEARSHAIAAALAPPLDVAPFDMTVGSVGAFPASGSPRVVWAALTGGTDGLAALEREVTARLQACGVPPDDRAYRPHLTLARVKQPGGLRTHALLDGLGDVSLGTTRIEAITLFESKLSPKSPTYVAVQRTALH